MTSKTLELILSKVPDYVKPLFRAALTGEGSVSLYTFKKFLFHNKGFIFDAPPGHHVREFTPFTLGVPLGSGGFGTVYRSGAKIIKTINLEVKSAPNHIPNTIREIILAQFLNSELCEKCSEISIGYSRCAIRMLDGQYHAVCVLPFKEGQEEAVVRDLLQYLRHGKTITRDVVFKLIEGIRVMHEHEIIHNDIKPENILMVNDRPYWIDFGYATLSSYGMKGNVPQHTRGYSIMNLLSPEADAWSWARKKKLIYSYHSDWYALAMTICVAIARDNDYIEQENKVEAHERYKVRANFLLTSSLRAFWPDLYTVLYNILSQPWNTTYTAELSRVGQG